MERYGIHRRVTVGSDDGVVKKIEVPRFPEPFDKGGASPLQDTKELLGTLLSSSSTFECGLGVVMARTPLATIRVDVSFA